MTTPADFDVARARAETPGCGDSAHFAASGAALMPRCVIDAIQDHIQLEARVGGYAAEARNQNKIQHTYDALADMLHCGSDEIALVENATRGWDMAFYAFDFGPGDRILTAQSEYASNYIAFLQIAKRTRAEIVPVPDDEHGQLDVAALKNLIDDRTRLIAVTHVPTSGGLVNPAAEIGRVANKAGVPYLLDACQAAGQMPLNVKEIGCDMLSATGRKFLRGPRGTGFLYVRRDLAEELEPPFLDLHAAAWTGPDSYDIRRDARRFENWESYVAGRIGLGVAVDYALEWGLDRIEARITALADDLRTRLDAISGVTVRDLGAKRCGIVTFTVDGLSAEEVKLRLAEKDIHVLTSTASGTLLDMQARGLTEVVRAGVHYYNTDAEIDRLVEAVAALR